MDEAIVPVCTPYYARQLQLTSNPASLRHCTLLHDRQAWSNDSGTDEWFSWAQQFGIELPQSSGIGFDRSDLAVIAAGVNVNQIAKRVNATGSVYQEDIEEIKEVLAEIWRLQRLSLLKAR